MIPSGKGCFIWNLIDCARGDPQMLAEMALAARFNWVAIKLANGMADFNADLAGPAISALSNVGVNVFGWQYLYGGNVWTGASIAAKEAAAPLRALDRYQLAGWIGDPEREYKRKGAAAWADTYMHALRASRPQLSIGLCSYRFPSLHPELPWTNFLAHSDFHMPQVYWVEATNPGSQLMRSLRELNALKKLPFIPVGSAYFEHGWGPTVAQLNEFDQTAHELGLPGEGWWCWDDNGLESHPDWWNAIATHQWGAPPIPPQRWDMALTQWARSMGYTGPDPN